MKLRPILAASEVEIIPVPSVCTDSVYLHRWPGAAYFVGENGALVAASTATYQPAYVCPDVESAAKAAWLYYKNNAITTCYKTPIEFVKFRLGLLWAKLVGFPWSSRSSSFKRFLYCKAPKLNTMARQSLRDLDSMREIVVRWRKS